MISGTPTGGDAGNNGDADQTHGFRNLILEHNKVIQ